MEFFIALFGGIYWIWKLARADTQKKRDKISDECRRAYLTSLTDKYFATCQLTEKVENHIRIHMDELLKEFHEDLTYIYGSGFDTYKDRITKPIDWYYSIQESLKHLILARDYKKMVGFIGGYSSGIRQEQTPYSLRLFKKINDYMNVKECRLTLQPYSVGSVPGWSVHCAKFKPEVWNVYANHPESNEEYWMQYC